MKPRVLVLGDSLSGLVAAWRLCMAEFQVTILTPNGHPDETTSSFPPPAISQNLDSPHSERVEPNDVGLSTPLVWYGSHKRTDSLLQELNIATHAPRWRTAPFEFKTPSLPPSRFPNTLLPAPWHTVLGILNFTALPYSQRWHLINFVEKVWEGVATLPNALNLDTAESWLLSIGQPPPVHKTVWNPLCRFLLGTSLAHSHAGSFAAMLTQVFFLSRHHRPHLAQTTNLSTSLEHTLTEQLTARGATIARGPTIEYLQVESEQITGVCGPHGSLHTADWYVSTLHPSALSSLLPERLLARYSSFQQLSQTTFAPIVTFHMETNLEMKKPRLLLHDGPFSWTLCRPHHRSTRTSTLLSCVSTHDADLLAQSDEEITARAMETLRDLFADDTNVASDPPHPSHIVRQPLGFVPHPLGTKPYRPSNQTPIRNFLLAGSWTDTGAITEIESAITSGELCAQAVLTQSGKAN